MKFLTTHQVADTLAVKEFTVRRMILRGSIRAARINGRDLRIEENDLRDFVDAHRIKTQKRK